METILSSDYTSNILGVDENQLCLIDVNCEGIVRQITAEFPPDNRIVFAGQQQCAIIADWNKGVVCQSLVDGRVLWRNKKAIHATKLRMAADESSLIVCRNDPPMTLQLELKRGEVCQEFKHTTDLFVNGTEGGLVEMSLDLTLNARRGRSSSKLEWGVFAIFEGVFSQNDFFVSGPSGSMAVYDILKGCVRVPPRQPIKAVRTMPIRYDRSKNVLLGVAFEPDARPCCALVAFDEALAPIKHIAEFELVHGAAFCDAGRKLCTTSGKLFDTESGELLAIFDWQRKRG